MLGSSKLIQCSTCTHSNADTITVTSPPLDIINGSLTEELVQALVLRVAGEVIADVEFIYKPNPVISDVFPLQTIQA